MHRLRRVATLADLPQDRGTRVEVDDTAILLVRDGMQVHAYQATCPHAGAPLERGVLCAGRIICPWHKANFRVADGSLCEPPALDDLARYPVRVDKGDVYVSSSAIDVAHPPRGEDARTFVVIGAGAAGTAAVAALRDAGYAGRLLLIGAEPDAPYDRTALSKFVIAGEMPPADVPPLRPDDWWQRRDVERITAKVVRLKASAREIRLADGRTLNYDAALLATGGQAKSLEVPGHDLPGIHLLRSRAQAAAILADLRPGAHAVIVGNSFIGLEAASALRKAKVEVSVVAPHGIPFAKPFGERLGRMFRALHEAHGVTFHSETEVERFEGEGRVRTVVLKDGKRLAADLVILGVGVSPATDFVEDIAREEDGGLRVDTRMRLAEGLWASGDIVRYPYRGQQVRIEHWRLAQQQGRLAAANMLGAQQAFEAVPFFWTYHFGKRFEYLGHAEKWDEELIEGDLGQQCFIALLIVASQVQAVIACQYERATARLCEEINGSLSVERAQRLIRESIK
ncbi:FAD-dependent oxidoreductase [Pseudomonas sp. RIT-PI-AD]|uniref:FAD-dependent oxidoreductase n=1 Tax=Pseudomonas sp. RIT-PI-AD TaxID=3035294 RepID=UPI0021D9F7B9|nr:FAD-dependent oxidoreductase [Pseudomonas sp. RIT-PI-AD]